MQSKWEQAENFICKVLGVKRTKRSGAQNGDGDLIDETLIVEVKDQASIHLDQWWSKVRKEALDWDRIPILIMRRPPEKIGKLVGSQPEYLVCMDLGTFHMLYDTLKSKG